MLAGVERYGLAEYLGAGPDAVAKFEHGEIVCPVGHALVRAAIDWRRAGFTRCVPRSVLIDMLPPYLAGRDDVPRSSEALDEGFVWATEKINETVALLRRRDHGGSSGDEFQAFEYLVDYLARRNDDVPNEMWLLAVTVATPAESAAVGYAAYGAGRVAVAEEACRCAAYAGDTGAMRNLDVLVERRQETVEAGPGTAEAETWFRRAASDRAIW